MTMSATRTESKPALDFLRPIETELRQVEELLHAELTSSVKTVFAVSRHILDAGGKRLRPSLVLLCARACRPDLSSIASAKEEGSIERAIGIAASVELIHMATLMHDDVIDGADSRRGQRTANSYWGNQISVLAGDYMLAKATSLLGADGDPELIRILSQATISMTEGEIGQIESSGDTDASMGGYIAIIRNKTAEFMSACCRMGAVIGGGSPQMSEALAQYGLNLGIAFQITDDLLDLVGDPAHTGKPVGGDIHEGKVTLPMILALERVKPADREAMEAILRGAEVTPADVEFIRQKVVETKAVDETLKVACEYVGQATDALESVPQSEARAALEAVAGHVLRRKA